MIKCCKPCVPPRRHSGCHDKCAEYLAEKAKYEAAKKDLHKNDEYYDYKRGKKYGY